MLSSFTKFKYLMSNILIIKQGSLGDIVQISGVLKDIRENHPEDKIFILTTAPYVELLSICPYVDGTLIDKRLPRWNILYLLKLKKLLNKFNFSKVYDLQNSSRTSFYRKYLLKLSKWSSTETTLKKGESKKIFDKDSVLKRFEIQMTSSGIKTKHTLKPDFSWSIINIDKIINKYLSGKFILLFPFCSPNLSHKKWPYYNELIDMIKKEHQSLEIVIAPGPVKTPIWKKINQKDEVKRYDNSDFRESVSRAMKMTEKMEQAGCEPSVIAERALSIIENSKNKTRYRIDPTRIQNIMLQLFPKRVADRMIAKRMKILNK